MGCQVTSVYADEVVGVIGYPQQVLDDLMKRDYSSSSVLKPGKKSKYNVYGFSQSFAEGDLYTTVINKKQYFVYVAGRFLMRVDIKSKEQNALMHPDKIVSLDVKSKLAVTGIVGGKITVWDLEFLQKKIEVKMPSESTNFSCVGITYKYIFCVDTNQPKNNVYCYDLRTSKLKARAYLGSFQPTLRGKTWRENHIVTVAADGVWFSRFSESQNLIDITKGMFRIYPKTSMTCLDVVNDEYVVSGGVDGYVFLWARYQCQRVLRSSQSSISSIHISENNFILSSFNNNTKVFSFEIKIKENMEEDEEKNGEITADFVSIVVDSYEKSSPVQSICSSLLDPSIYYAQTRDGILFDKMIPSAQYISRISLYKNFDLTYMNFNKASSKYVYDQSIWLLTYSQFEGIFKVQQLIHEKKEGWLKKNLFIASAVGYKQNPKKLNLFLPELMQIFYATQDQIKYSEVIKSDPNDDLKQKILAPHRIIKIENREEVVHHEDGEQIRQLDKLKVDGLVDVEINEKLYIVVFFNTQYSLFVYEKQAEGLQYRQIKSQEYQGRRRLEQLEIDGQKIEFEQIDGVIQLKSDADQEQTRINKLHCVRNSIIWPSKSGQFISIGGQTLIIHEN